MQNIIVIIAGIVSMLTAAGAFWLSFKVFVRQRSFENENHFFTYKLERYQVIIQQAAALHSGFYDTFLDIKEQLSDSFVQEEDLNEQLQQLDDAVDKFRLVLYQHAAFVPEPIVLRLDNFYNSLFDVSDSADAAMIRVADVNAVLPVLNAMETELEAINNLMRHDLGIAVLDRRLKSRVQE